MTIRLGASILGAAAFVLLSGGPLSAATIFLDNFDRANSNIVGNGWAETEGAAASVAINNNQLVLSNNIGGTGVDAQVLQGSFSTVGFTNITVSFDYRQFSNTAGVNDAADNDRLYFAWGTSSAASTVNPVAGFFSASSTILSSGNINLGPLAAGTTIWVRLFTDVSEGQPGTAEGYRVDNFLVSGDAIVSQTPLPGALMLMVSGLAGFGGVAAIRRRRTKASN